MGNKGSNEKATKELSPIDKEYLDILNCYNNTGLQIKDWDEDTFKDVLKAHVKEVWGPGTTIMNRIGYYGSALSTILSAILNLWYLMDTATELERDSSQHYNLTQWVVVLIEVAVVYAFAVRSLLSFCRLFSSEPDLVDFDRWIHKVCFAQCFCSLNHLFVHDLVLAKQILSSKRQHSIFKHFSFRFCPKFAAYPLSISFAFRCPLPSFSLHAVSLNKAFLCSNAHRDEPAHFCNGFALCSGWKCECIHIADSAQRCHFEEGVRIRTANVHQIMEAAEGILPNYQSVQERVWLFSRSVIFIFVALLFPMPSVGWYHVDNFLVRISCICHLFCRSRSDCVVAQNSPSKLCEHALYSILGDSAMAQFLRIRQ